MTEEARVWFVPAGEFDPAAPTLKDLEEHAVDISHALSGEITLTGGWDA